LGEHVLSKTAAAVSAFKYTPNMQAVRYADVRKPAEPLTFLPQVLPPGGEGKWSTAGLPGWVRE
jgi:hypothetical protein